MPQKGGITGSMRIDACKQRRDQQPEHQCDRNPVNDSTDFEAASGKRSARYRVGSDGHSPLPSTASAFMVSSPDAQLRQIASPSANTIGPTKTPTSPEAATPPMTPNMTMMNGTCVALLMSSGRNTLSVGCTSNNPHMRRMMPFQICPVISKSAPRGPQTSAVPRTGTTDTTPVTAPKSTDP